MIEEAQGGKPNAGRGQPALAAPDVLLEVMMSWLKAFFDMLQSSDRLGDSEKKWVENVATMEAAVATLRDAQPNSIGKEVLETIVSSSGGTYSKWWSDHSRQSIAEHTEQRSSLR